MHTKSSPITHDEACQLLGLSLRRKHAADDVERAYKREAQRWSIELSTALCPTARRRAADALCLLQEARRILLNVAKGAGSRASVGSTPMPGANRRGAKPAFATSSPAPSVHGRGPFQAFLKACLGCVLVIVAVLRALPLAVRHAASALRTVGANLEARGIPRAAVLLIFIIGILSMAHGCGHVVGAVPERSAGRGEGIVILIALLSAPISGFLAVILFEAFFAAVKTRSSTTFNKMLACRGWWAFVILLALFGGPGGFLLSLVVTFPLGMSHCLLAETEDNIITLSDVVRNIPGALRTFASRVRPFIK